MLMLWLILSIGSAFFRSMEDVFSKQSTSNVNEYIVGWMFRLIAASLIFVVIVIRGLPVIQEGFILTLILNGSLNAIVTILYLKALKHTDLSLVSPLVSLTPLFILLFSPLILGEWPDTYGLFGVIFIVIGTYILNMGKRSDGFCSPITSLAKNKGARYMLLVAIIWAITSNLDKIGVTKSGPLFWVFSVNLFVSIVLIPQVCIRRAELRALSESWKLVISIGVFSALTVILQMYAITMTLVVYVIAIKRSSTLLSVLWGYLFFKEKAVPQRLVGAAIMFLGLILIMLT